MKNVVTCDTDQPSLLITKNGIYNNNIENYACVPLAIYIHAFKWKKKMEYNKYFVRNVD